MSRLRRHLPRTYVALRNLERTRAQTALAVVTVVVGVVAVGGLGLFGLAFEAGQEERIGALANEIQIQSDPVVLLETGESAIGGRELATIEAIAGDAVVVPIQTPGPPTGLSRQSVGRQSDDLPAGVVGVGEPEVLYDVVDGEISDPFNRGAIISKDVAEQENIAVDDAVTIENDTYRVVAIVEEPDDVSSAATIGRNAVVPVEFVEGDGYDAVIVQAENAIRANEIGGQVEAALTTDDGRSAVRVSDRGDEAETIQRQFAATTQFLGSVAAIAFLIAAISIANIQLMSVRERRGEIGLLRAVGYDRRDIVAIVLIETLAIGVLAAVVGVAASVAAGAGINLVFLDDPTAFQPGSTGFLLGGFLFGVTVCVVAGLYPAWVASKELPAEALRGR